ncbi:DNA polymerase I [Butyrivibrio sp. XPD2002]|uniref:DNA polymerase I n=1 Tax=Butyrivibrio sp. XPD2002 TaxID=1280665 RepID=UPI0004151C9D|nr:DNA polymerase I [Butyrivibrio sp. XPD2002]
MGKKLLLIDGHSILNRAFYGLPDLTNSEGLHTGAVYGFLNILFRLIDEEQPDYVTVAFDVHEPTFRHKIYAEYKGTRKPMPEELRQQVPLMKEVLDSMKICRMEKPGLEADDILGTIAKRGEKEGMEVRLVSGDRDLLQVATDHICVRIPKTKAGKTEIENYFAKDVEELYKVNPIQFIELKALMGDSSDNIPGVPKVGEKTAIELMTTYGSIEKIYENLDNISKKSIRESLAANRELCDLSKVLATIDVNAEFDYEFENAGIDDILGRDAYEMFKRLNFRNLLSRFDDNVTKTEVKLVIDEISGMDKVEAAFKEASVYAGGHDDRFIGIGILSDLTGGVGKGKENQQLSLFETFEEPKTLIGFAICTSDNKVTYFETDDAVTEGYLGQKLEELSKDCRLSFFDIKHAYRYFKPFEIDNYEDKKKASFDTLIGAYLINPLKNDYLPEDIATEYLQLSIRSKTEIFGKENPADADKDLRKEYAGYLAYVNFMAAPKIEERLEKEDMLTLMTDIEMPLTYILYDMEKEGILVKRDELKIYGDKLTGRINELDSSIHEEVKSTTNGEVTDFNINSPKQLGEILFEKLGLQGGKKTKTGYSTAADVLEKLAAENPIVKDILEYRGLTKLKSTYADGLAAFIGDDERIHTSFNQTITATGRISSTEPNLQNIPMRTELGRAIRKVFVPKEGYVFADADYSQIELRILAHMSGDKGLIDAYHEGKDIHRATASKVFGIPFEEVTDIQRRNAKAVNFGIVYGISAFGLSEDLNISRSDAKKYMEDYLATYPGVKEYQDKAVNDAKEKGYAITLYKRRRPMPELKSGNFMQRQFGERVAMNAPIQGTAADIIKIAMIRVWRRIRKEELKSRMILQIHDELLIETAKDEVEIISKLLEEEMTKAADLLVPMEAECHTGTDWFEAK